MKASLLSTLLFWCCWSAMAQPFRTPSFYQPDYIYRITSEEAQYLLDHDLQSKDTTFFHDFAGVVDDSEDTLGLPYGHYIAVNSISGAQLTYTYLPVTPWRIYMPENGTDFLVQLTDIADNTPISTATVKINNKPVPFDPETSCYKIGRGNQKGILTVQYQGETFFYTVSRDRNSAFFYKLWRVSERYLVEPAIFLACLPVDGYQSVKKKKAQGNISKVKQAAAAAIRSLRSKEKQYSYAYKWHRSHFFFSKPKYREGDTVKFKAHILNAKTKQWIDKPLWVYLENDKKEELYLGKIKPERKGDGYSFRFILSDSMGLSLDKRHSIILKTRDSQIIASEFFLYEDYELTKTVFGAKLLHKDEKHFRGKPFALQLTASDENGLPVHDARAELFIEARSVSGIGPDALFVPDILWEYNTEITNGEKTIQIPDSIFPSANIDYKLAVTMLNSENEWKRENYYIDFRESDYEVGIALQDDSITFQAIPYSGNIKAHIYAVDRFDLKVFDKWVTLPYTAPINTHALTYTCETDDVDEELELDQQHSEVGAYTNRTTDTLFFDLVNPRKLNVVYHLYRNDREIRRGAGKMVALRIPASEKDKYNMVLEYVWAGKTEATAYNIGVPKSIVKLNVQQPPVIYPGKETEISITATDYRNRPISGMSILAYAFTNKFAVGEPYLPYIGADFPDKKCRNKFRLEESEPDSKSMKLNFSYWNKARALDTNWYYSFLFPQGKALTFFSETIADSVTQIAPFIVDSGEIQPVYYVLIDSIPVFFGFTDARVPYSFMTDTLPHQIKVRTPKQLITINGIRANACSKTIFSVSPAVKDKSVTVEALPDTFTKAELDFLSFYIMGLSAENNFLRNAYMTGGSSDVVLSFNRYERNIRAGFSTIGPVVWKYWKFNALNNFSLDFEYEPFYHYHFGRERVKMKSIGNTVLFPRKLPRYIPGLNEQVLTETGYLRQYKAELDRKRYEEAFPAYNDTLVGRARLKIEVPLSLGLGRPLNIILFRKEDFKFIKVYSGKTREFDKLPEGQYELLFVERGNLYRKTGIIEVRNGGQNFYRVCWLDSVRGKGIGSIDTLLCRMYEGNGMEEMPRIMNEYIKATYQGPLHAVSGTVLDENGEPMPGASVIIDNTTMGTVTDMDGNFALEIPAKISNPLLWFKSLGVKDTLIEARSEMIVRMSATDQLLGLSEVMIYGRKIDKRSYTGALITVTSNHTSPKSVIEAVRAIEGAAPGVQVHSGAGGEQILFGIPGAAGAGSNALVVIDGAIYNGGMASLDPAIVESLSFLKDATATSIYGSRGANGVVLITTKKGAVLPENIKKGLGTLQMPEALMAGSLRNNFRDDAYWQPDLRTDADGKVSFKVKFPDDITAWKTFAFATDAHRHTGQSYGLIRSYKPVSASLLMPAFLVQGDTAHLLGKSANYMPDSLPVTTSYFIDSLLVSERKIKLGEIDTAQLQLTAGYSDTIRLKYMLRKDDGYFDGEERVIPVLPKGIMVAKGGFLSLDMSDTSFALPEESYGDTLCLSATTSLLDVIDEEIKMVEDYEHLCNEQLASKIIAALQQQQLTTMLHRPFGRKDKARLQEMVDQLLQRRNPEKLWSWWENGATVDWISSHVIHALLAAKRMQYDTGDLSFETILQPLLYKWQTDTAYADLQSLKLLYEAGIKTNYGPLISRLEQRHINLSGRLSLLWMRQQLGLPYDTRLLQAMSREDLFGNIYWADTTNAIYANELLTTLTAFRIIQADSIISINRHKVINWLLQQRNIRGWRNIYESAQIIEALAPAIALESSKAAQPKLSFTGQYEEEVSRFPFRKNIAVRGPVKVRKQGKAPVYFSWYRQYRDTTNNELGENFILNSHFEENGNNVSALHAGVPVTMKVTLQVDKSAEFVMIGIPVPAGCSYEEKRQSYKGHEVHREYRKDKVSIFCERLSPGTYTFDIALLPRYTGTYTINPSKAELMYFPVFYGRSPLQTVSIR